MAKKPSIYFSIIEINILFSILRKMRKEEVHFLIFIIMIAVIQMNSIQN